ncbi:2'-5' RNA ligase [Desulfurococcus mucosus DSM 2162]|uniref:RNA 2',3'-cyclic phosphodiesterase n=1 Tax=Desulfurococcus mucosus (strain ATCC 35584 / DSM 2162 / JCM 9187 / O7/1) TaxID=765177 RepID=E8R8R7_DESM0|nr:2'-5' RNA ligase [Desulfurococcus mucosus DSM 2162]
MSSELVRSFIAIEVKNRDVLRRLIEARDRVAGVGVDLKPVEDENIHLTLRFIGEVPRSTVEEVCGIVTGISFKPFEMHVKGIGGFPSLERPRVIWAGIEEGAGELLELYRVVEAGLRRLGVKPEREEFTPHITLARVKGYRGLEKLVKVLLEMRDMDFGYTPVDEVIVKKSVLTPRGPIYSNICVKKLVQQ